MEQRSDATEMTNGTGIYALLRAPSVATAIRRAFRTGRSGARLRKRDRGNSYSYVKEDIKIVFVVA